jgi:hypothetical protein
MNILTGETDRDIRRYQYTYNADNIGFADPAKLLRHGPFDWQEYTPIEVETDGVRFWVVNGMTRIENARRAGIKMLPAYIFRR